jgi:hypothetical protein
MSLTKVSFSMITGAPVNVKDFGAVGDGIADDTAALQAAFDYAFPLRRPVYIPSGTYLYSSLSEIDESNVTINGDGSNNTVLKFTGTGIALKVGTQVVGSEAGFRQGINLSGFTVEGNVNTSIIVNARLMARSFWNDINVREANPTTGIGFQFDGCQLSSFNYLMCSQDRNSMTNPPLEGFNINAVNPQGNSTNNVWTNLYAEGLWPASANSINIGVRITGGDQNVFIGGSPESCKTYGTLVSSLSKFNTFIGVGWENLDAISGDVGDAGTSSRYINCYSSDNFIIQGRSCVVQGGYFERIQIDNTASRTRVQDVTINNWNTGSGGFVDNGISSFYSNIFDIDSGNFVYPRGERTNIATSASPTSWSNDRGQFVEVISQSGTVSQVRMIRGTDSWTISPTSPNSYLVGPNDTIEFTYSSVPSLSFVPYNGFQG